MLCKVFLLLLLRCGHGRFLRIFQVWPVNAPMWKAPSPGFLHQPCSAERLSTPLFRAWRLAYWQTHILEYVTPAYDPWSSSASITVANETPVEGTSLQWNRYRTLSSEICCRNHDLSQAEPQVRATPAAWGGEVIAKRSLRPYLTPRLSPKHIAATGRSMI